jgi:5-formyltetrahydrofolate cyclo-ligase
MSNNSSGGLVNDIRVAHAASRLGGSFLFSEALSVIQETSTWSRLPMPPHTAPSKDHWRAQFRAYRRALGEPAYAARSALICTRALGLRAVATASVVHAYWPQVDQGEVDTRPLIGALRGRETTVALPVVTSYDPDAPTMEHRRYAGPSAMAPNRWGIREPVGTARVSPDDLDAVLVPALGADRRGHRIGHGSGYYDAFLQAIDAPKIILVYDRCLRTEVPAEAHDVPGTHIVTEHGSTAVAAPAS